MKNIKKLNKHDDIKLAEIRYGLEAFYLTITKLIIIVFFAILLKTTKNTLLFLAFSQPIRCTSSGFHANSSFQCLITSFISFILFPLLADYVNFNLISICILYLIILIGYFIMAPKDTKKKPIVNKKKWVWLKILSVLVVIIYFIISLLIINSLIINIMLFALIVQLLMISPIPYKLFKQEYNFKWFK